MKAVSTNLEYVRKRSCPPGLYHSLWEVLCSQLFEQHGFDTDGVFPDLFIWSKDVSPVSMTYPYSFTISTSSSRTPRISDIIFFNRKVYIIGKVDDMGAGSFFCTECDPIDASILAVYSELKRLGEINRDRIQVNTTAYWNSQRGYVPRAGDFIIYTDYNTIEKEGHIIYVPGIKVGDGKAYVQDLPFLDDSTSEALIAHINDDSRHITEEERTRWNNKINVNDSAEIEGEALIFNRN